MAALDAQQFLNELDKKLWTAADRLRSNQDAVVYKGAFWGQPFLELKRAFSGESRVIGWAAEGAE